MFWDKRSKRYLEQKKHVIVYQNNDSSLVCVEVNWTSSYPDIKDLLHSGRQRQGKRRFKNKFLVTILQITELVHHLLRRHKLILAQSMRAAWSGKLKQFAAGFPFWYHANFIISRCYFAEES